MTALTVEDGTGVTGANSFASLATARAFATLRGVTLSAVDATLTAYLVKGTDYLRALSYIGTKTYPGQSYLPWPRTGLTIDDEELAGTVIPTDIIDALCQLCIEQQAGVILNATSTGPGVKRDKVGPLETEYAVANGSGNAAKATMPIVSAYLKPYVKGATIRTYRA